MKHPGTKISTALVVPLRNSARPKSFGAMIAAEIPNWAEAVRAAGVRLD